MGHATAIRLARAGASVVCADAVGDTTAGTVTIDGNDIRDYTTVRDTPLALGVLLALLAVGALAHVLVTVRPAPVSRRPTPRRGRAA